MERIFVQDPRVGRTQGTMKDYVATLMTLPRWLSTSPTKKQMAENIQEKLSKICRRQLLENLHEFRLLKTDPSNFLKTIIHKLYLVHF